jgi:hypothetical protein
MDIKTFKTSIVLTLAPVFYEDQYPKIIVRFADDIIFSGLLTKSTDMYIDKNILAGNYKLVVELTNKTDNDCNLSNNQDKAVLIENLIVNGIECRKCLHNSKYYPNYSKSYIDTLITNGEEIVQCRESVMYLGWNGEWTLNISVPAFIWLHKEKGLGWIYD